MSGSMPESHSMLKPLSRNDLKRLAKEADKAKRDENARSAKMQPETYAAIGSSVSFDAPVKVSEADVNSRRHLERVLGRYEETSSAIMSGRTRDLMGVELQPATPLPSRNADQDFFVDNRKRPANGKNGPRHNSNNANVMQNRNDGAFGSSARAPTISSKPPRSIAPSSAGPSTTHQRPGQTSSADAHSSHSKLNTHPQGSQKAHQQKPAKTVAVRKEPAVPLVKHPPLSTRQPLLDQLSQELKSDRSSKSDSAQARGSATNLSSSQSVSKSDEKCTPMSSSKPASSDPLSVLRENRNGDVFNGKPGKSRLSLRIPEKNVEDMLKELTHMPQPLTGIQTPAFKDSKFPFQDKDETVQQTNKEVTSGQLSRPGRDGHVVHSVAPVGSERQTKEIEEIRSPSDDSDSSDNSGSNSSDDDDDDMEEGQISDSGSEKVIGAAHISASDRSKLAAGGKVLASSTPTVAATTTAAPSMGMPSHTAPMKEPRAHKMSPSSSGSSSSGSESSDSGSDSESDDASEEEKSHDQEQEKAAAPKTKHSPAYTEATPSPARPKWELKAYLNTEPSLINLNNKPPSVEHYEEDTGYDGFIKRSADNISDENPASVDQDGCSKPMSADEFSPPSHIDKLSVLSPIKSPQPVKSPSVPVKSPAKPVKSPIKSPVKRSYRKSSDSERPPKEIQVKVESSPYQNTYDTIKKRERKTSQSFSNTSIDVPPHTGKPKKSHGTGRKPKTKEQAPAVDFSVSESDSDNDAPLERTAFSPKKSRASTPKQSLHSSSNEKVCSTKPSLSVAKKKETKQEKKYNVKNNFVKGKGQMASPMVKQEILSPDCDRKASISLVNESDSIEKMLESFPGEKPLSPIPNDPEAHMDVHDVENLRRIGLEVGTVAPIPVSVSTVNRKPSVLVQIDLVLLKKYLYTDRTKSNFLKLRSSRRMSEVSGSDDESPKHQNILSSAKMSLASKVKHDKGYDEKSKVLPSTSKRSANSLQYSANSRSSASDRSSIGASDQVTSASVSIPNVSQKVAMDTSDHDAIPSFDSLPMREATNHERLSDESSCSDSCDSDKEESKPYISKSVARNSNLLSPLRQDPPFDKKKRKLDSHHADEPKRRKTLPKLSPHNQATLSSSAAIKDESYHDDVLDQSSKRPSSERRERHGSASSQLSTLSHHSSHSQHSTHSQRSQRSSGSSSHSKQKRGGGAAKGSSNESVAAVTPTPAATPSSHDLRLASAASSSFSSSSSSSLLSTSSQSLSSQSPEKSASKHVSACEAVLKHNGHLPQSSPASGRLDIPTTRPRAVVTPSRPALAMHSVPIGAHDEMLLPAEDYHRQAKKFKHQADALEACLQKNMLYVEAVLCFMQSGYAMEKKQAMNEAFNLYKETRSLIPYRSHHLRSHLDHETGDRAELKLTVLCIRIQSLLYLKLYMLKKTETYKLKGIIDEHNSKSMKSAASQPKLPSAPSPHQSNWNRSTGTPSPMSPTPSPANSVCSVGSVGSDQTPSKLTNGTSGSAASMAAAHTGSVLVPQRIHSITQRYFSFTNYLMQAHEFWDQANHHITPDVKDFFAQLDHDNGPLTFHSNILHLVKYVARGLNLLNMK